MKKLLTFFCLILLSGHSHSQDVFTGPFLERDGITYHQDTNELVTGIVESFYENGQLRSRTNYKDGKKEGFYKSFHNNDELKAKGNYKSGKADGLWELFYENGQLRSGGRFIDGKRQGWWSSFNEDGTARRGKFYKYGEVEDPLKKILERTSVD